MKDSKKLARCMSAGDVKVRRLGTRGLLAVFIRQFDKGEEVSRLISCLGLTARGAKDRRDVDGKSLVL